MAVNGGVRIIGGYSTHEHSNSTDQMGPIMVVVVVVVVVVAVAVVLRVSVCCV